MSEPEWWAEARRLAAIGHALSEIAERTGRSPKTVRRVLDGAYRKVENERYRHRREHGTSVGITLPKAPWEQRA